VSRLQLLVRAWLVALDQLLYVTFAGPLYLAGLAALPSPQETISSIVGRKSLEGRRWARIAEPIIDHIFTLLGEPPGHCRRSIVGQTLPGIS
jgi:hypothetical protein